MNFDGPAEALDHLFRLEFAQYMVHTLASDAEHFCQQLLRHRNLFELRAIPAAQQPSRAPLLERVEVESDYAWPGGGRSLYLRDPAGNSVELGTPAIWRLPESATFGMKE